MATSHLQPREDIEINLREKICRGQQSITGRVISAGGPAAPPLAPADEANQASRSFAKVVDLDRLKHSLVVNLSGLEGWNEPKAKTSQQPDQPINEDYTDY